MIELASLFLQSKLGTHYVLAKDDLSVVQTDESSNPVSFKFCLLGVVKLF